MLDVELPVKTLKPYGALHLDVSSLELGNPFDARFVAIDLKHTGSPGDIVADLVTVDSSFRYSFFDPFVDSARGIISHTGIDFSLEGSRNHVLAVSNTSDNVTTVRLDVFPESGTEVPVFSKEYALGGRTLSVFDLKDLRDSALPGEDGLPLPPDMVSGHLRISASSAGIVVGDVAFDSARSQATCLDPCECDPPGFSCIVPITLPFGENRLDVPSKLVHQCGSTPDPPTLHDEFTNNYLFGLDPNDTSTTSCTYLACTGQQFIGVCGSTIVTGLQSLGGTPGCFMALRQSFRLRTFWPALVTCDKVGSAQSSFPNCF